MLHSIVLGTRKQTTSDMEKYNEMAIQIEIPSWKLGQDPNNPAFTNINSSTVIC